MSRGVNEMLEATPSTDELMDVNTAFLDAYRRGGSEELKRAQQQARLSAAPAPAIDAALIEVGAGEFAGVAPHPKAETLPLGAGDALDPGEDVEPELEPDHEPDPGDTERSGREGQHGGGESASAASTATSGEMIPGSAPDTVATDTELQPQQEDGDLAEAALDDEVVTVPTPPHAATGETTPASLQLTDHQEAVQNGAPSTKGGSGDSEDGAALPQSGFRLSGVKSQPAVRALPGVVVSTLREQLRSAAVRELGVPDAAARQFSERLSQVSLVTAFLLAQLDLGLDADASTRLAADLFRSRDPLLGSVAARLDGLEKLEVEHTAMLGTLHDELAAVRQTTAVVEQAVAYSIADRTKNFLRGSHNIHDAPITHQDAIFIRDKARDATKKQTRHEREREGRPIR